MQYNPLPVFHAFTIKYNALANRITTDVQLFKAFDPTQTPKPPLPLFETTALWDTGATSSMVTKATVEALGLLSVGSMVVKHVGGSSQSNTYLVNVFLPNNSAPAPSV